MVVHLVLQEDVYETCFGDGYFAYLCAAFADAAAASAWLTVAAQSKEYKYHLRSGDLHQAPDGSWHLVVTLADGERATGAEVAKLLGLS